jgi:hypothetical protein
MESKGRSVLDTPLARSMTVFVSTAQTRLCPSYGTDLPDGQITDFPVQPPLQKYFRFGLTQIRCISITVSFRQEGRSRVVTNAGRDAVDVRASGAQRQSQGEMNLVSGQLACKMIGA